MWLHCVRSIDNTQYADRRLTRIHCIEDIPLIYPRALVCTDNTASSCTPVHMYFSLSYIVTCLIPSTKSYGQASTIKTVWIPILERHKLYNERTHGVRSIIITTSIIVASRNMLLSSKTADRGVYIECMLFPSRPIFIFVTAMWFYLIYETAAHRNITI